MPDVSVKLVVAGESTETVDFTITKCPDPVYNEIQKGLDKANVTKAKSIGQIQDSLIQILKALKDNHPNKDKKTAHVTLTANGVKLLDRDLLL